MTTNKEEATAETMHVLIVNFQLNGLSMEEYQQQAAAVAPLFASLPGLISKIFISDEATNTYGGVYVWNNQQAMEQYLLSDIFQSIQANPHFTHVTTRDFAVLTAPTEYTWMVSEADPTQ